MTACRRNGCGKSFDPAATDNDLCHFHPGDPIFHEGRKGWQCCNKRVDSFEEFLQIPGCSVGLHSVEDPVPVVEGGQTISPADKSQATAVPKVVQPGVEVFSAAVPHVNPSTKANLADSKPHELPQDPANAEIPVGAVCKRNGCGFVFKSREISCGGGSESRCTFHRGTPIFHEGSKGWSCCNRKVLEFDEFLKIKGCQSDRHLFTDIPESSTAIRDKSQSVSIRHDWYQSPAQVTISVFAKGVDPKTVHVTFEEKNMKIQFNLPNSQVQHQWNLELFERIDPSSCSYSVMRTKIEISLKKANGISWPALEPVDNITTWTTFGITGRTGTVGAKEMQVSNDSPLLNLNR